MSETHLRTFRDHRLSLFQSAAQHAGPALEQAATRVAAREAGGALLPDAHPADVAPEAWTCAELGYALLQAELDGNAAERRRLEAALDSSRCDPRWAGTLLSYLGYFGPQGDRRAIPYVKPAAAGTGVIALPAGARIALLSDWGTGQAPAGAVLDDVRAQRPDIVVHLGNIYYAGTSTECEQKFYAPLRAALGPSVPIYTLSGNHDMYSGGEGYYGLIGRLNEGHWHQRASYFCLRDAAGGWQLLAMDTGLHAYDPFERHPLTFLDAGEEDWLAARIAEFPGKTILLSHHPLFPSLARIGPGGSDSWDAKLLRSFERFAGAGRIAAWFWGHEHILALYAPLLGSTEGAASAAAQFRSSPRVGRTSGLGTCGSRPPCCRRAWPMTARWWIVATPC